MLRHPRAKHWVRTWYSLRSAWQLKRASLEGKGYLDYFQAGRSVGGIERIEKAGDVIRRFSSHASSRAERSAR
jgi:nitronate monooxygenase